MQDQQQLIHTCNIEVMLRKKGDILLYLDQSEKTAIDFVLVPVPVSFMVAVFGNVKEQVK